MTASVLKQDPNRKQSRLCVCVIINKQSFELFMCLHSAEIMKFVNCFVSAKIAFFFFVFFLFFSLFFFFSSFFFFVFFLSCFFLFPAVLLSVWSVECEDDGSPFPSFSFADSLLSIQCNGDEICRYFVLSVRRFHFLYLFRQCLCQCGDFIFYIYFGSAFVSVETMVLLFTVSLFLTFCRLFCQCGDIFVVVFGRAFVSAEMMVLLFSLISVFC